ncbi:hypothetical protein GLAREA_02764 [Glarea lozoyensis ATCC 20868]|uniref:Uncharacterized protein n=1 Tax=Glarea lozoyensis (strain ATCC 20868 / MF5171) TaxID=1116229 RepID=S3CMC1_GLAL2|nr:uncharacterized protein GLAREA_02764 [Glarea lozoyensis ATCC 20868]EPE26850.1 hypothetical protein GLAREA_02764 [Glarea lozoyensis ATCC 20868]
MGIKSKIAVFVDCKSSKTHSNKSSSRRPSNSQSAASFQQRSQEAPEEEMEAATLVVYVGPPGRFADKTRFICSLWSINLLLPTLTIEPVLLNEGKRDYPEVIINMDAGIFQLLHACVCASEGVTQKKSKNLTLFAKLWAFADGSISEALMEDISAKVTGTIKRAGIHELQEVMRFVCSQDHRTNSKVARMRDVLVGRLAVLGMDSYRLDDGLVPPSLLGDVMVSMDVLRRPQDYQKQPSQPRVRRPLEKAKNCNQIVWQELLKAVESPPASVQR